VPFLQVHLTLEGLDPETAEDACFATGAVSVTLSDAGDTPILEPLPGETPLWPATAVTALYDADTAIEPLAEALSGWLGRPALKLRFEHLADRVWEREWLKDFRPMRFGARLWVCPGGMVPPADATPAPIIVQLDPGLAFGTGTHATTALCLEWLDGAALTGARLLDVGCGSGILAVAGLILGAATAHGIDIDPQALIASTDNAARNGVGDRLSLAAAEAPWGEHYDVVLANILCEPLLALAPRIAAACRPGGTIVLSGLLSAQADAVTAAYRPWFDMEVPRERDGWVGLVGRRRR
jgi:ribosomal protein L11 methyltransferase